MSFFVCVCFVRIFVCFLFFCLCVSCVWVSCFFVFLSLCARVRVCVCVCVCVCARCCVHVLWFFKNDFKMYEKYFKLLLLLLCFAITENWSNRNNNFIMMILLYSDLSMCQNVHATWRSIPSKDNMIRFVSNIRFNVQIFERRSTANSPFCKNEQILAPKWASVPCIGASDEDRGRRLGHFEAHGERFWGPVSRLFSTAGRPEINEGEWGGPVGGPVKFEGK